ncbi:MAG TPA: patatin-like phospholipase family protein [Methylomusa anaerophila]|uniref:NTE family protein RssA n=1 Tax=Methylomusa anaerophila TaxID=1930071 RepID=A0A348AQ91_9FIRM|nr:patatin-like phospholipase family protein [Methylomusa anaerophila]BBB93239.1 NTE family protein RssA [Methylomusa anaerophila]HML86929.1 patatin-like phospholipase family protein [Methylomusa anaerophila]
MRPKVGLALGSGGLRGLTHVGVIKVLEENNIPIDYIAGCSIGSLIGALYSAGLDPDTIIKLGKNLRRRHWIDFVIPQMGIISGERAMATIKLLTRQKSFDQLNIPLAVVATDLISGKEYIFTEGDVAKAVRASISVPGIFNPYEMDGLLLVDGAVLNPTPIDVARRMGADIVIAVDLAHAGTVGNINNMFDVIVQAIDIMEKALFKQREDDCDILIQPAIAHISPSSFDSMDECVELGAQAALSVIPDIQHMLTNSE